MRDSEPGLVLQDWMLGIESMLVDEMSLRNGTERPAAQLAPQCHLELFCSQLGPFRHAESIASPLRLPFFRKPGCWPATRSGGNDDPPELRVPRSQKLDDRLPQVHVARPVATKYPPLD